jgi:hypothetical protein
MIICCEKQNNSIIFITIFCVTAMPEYQPEAMQQGLGIESGCAMANGGNRKCS